GCQLLRAHARYRESGGPNQTFSYDTVWLTPWTFVPFHPLNALSLEMHKDPRDPPGIERDLNDHIIIADDVVDFLGATPYDQFTAWCDRQNLDWFIFGWDWRRRLEDTVAFFVSKFLPLFQSTVQARFGVDPLDD